MKMILKNKKIKSYSGNTANINVVYMGILDDIYLIAPPGLFWDKKPLSIKNDIKKNALKKNKFPIFNFFRK